VPLRRAEAYEERLMTEEDTEALRNDIIAVLNKHSRGERTGTENIVLAGYLCACLEAFETATATRDPDFYDDLREARKQLPTRFWSRFLAIQRPSSPMRETMADQHPRPAVPPDAEKVDFAQALRDFIKASIRPGMVIRCDVDGETLRGEAAIERLFGGTPSEQWVRDALAMPKPD
jgi:hypothetical protein